MILKENDTQLYITDAEVCQKLNVLKCYQFNVAIKLKFEFNYFGNFDSIFGWWKQGCSCGREFRFRKVSSLINT